MLDEDPSFDLVLVDRKLSGSDGLDLLREIGSPEATGVLLDISATGEENLIEQQSGNPMNDLEYRRKQLLKNVSLTGGVLLAVGFALRVAAGEPLPIATVVCIGLLLSSITRNSAAAELSVALASCRGAFIATAVISAMSTTRSCST